MITKSTIAFVAIFVAIHSTTFAQFPLGKNIDIAKIDIKSFLKKNGFTFLKEYPLGKNNDIFVISYSEEFRVTLQINGYENVTSINFISNKMSTFINLKNSLSFDKWKYIGESRDPINNNIESLYHFKNFKIRMDTQSKQFVVLLINDD